MLGRLSILIGCFVGITLGAASSLEQLTTMKTNISTALVGVCKDLPQEQKKTIYGALDGVNRLYDASKAMSDELAKTKAELERTKAELTAFKNNFAKLRSAAPQEAPKAPEPQPMPMPLAPQMPVRP